MVELKKTDSFPSFLFLNIKMAVVLIFVGIVWVVFYILFFWNFLRSVFSGKLQSMFWPANIFCIALSPILIFLIIGVLGKIIFMHMTIKCKKCGEISRADKWYCGNCGERLLDDDWIKLS